ncbi:MAG: DUF1223 domain-containing protein [Ginsengibacter sp.]
MKHSIHILLLSVPLFALWFCTASSAGKEKQDPNGYAESGKAGYKKVAVLELFTSQGCSSCPPADRLLGRYAAKENVIVLTFHVDYWDRLGWKDPFSAKAFTERQYHYASVIKADVYTPQLVINGQQEMIGSNQSKISGGVKKALSEEASAELLIKNVKAENGRVNINFAASGNTGGSILNVALLQNVATTEIKTGENGGVTLTNNNVVRNLKTAGQVIEGNNVSSIDLIQGLDEKNISVVLFLQDKNTNKIVAADKAAL